MTQAQGNALDAYVEAEAEAQVAAKVALVFAVKDESATPKLRAIFQKALEFYQTPQIDKILNA